MTTCFVDYNMHFNNVALFGYDFLKIYLNWRLSNGIETVSFMFTTLTNHMAVQSGRKNNNTRLER